jgi:hypothetical protein
MASAIGRQAGPIRLTKERAEKIIAGRGAELDAMGYGGTDGLLRFPYEVFSRPDKIIQGNGGAVVFVQEVSPRKVSAIRLEPEVQGDHYSVVTAFFSRPEYLRNRPVLWERAQSAQPKSPGAISGQRAEPEEKINRGTKKVKPETLHQEGARPLELAAPGTPSFGFRAGSGDTMPIS